METRSVERNRRPNSSQSAFIALFIARSIELSQIALRFLKSFVQGNVAQVFWRDLSVPSSLGPPSYRHLGERGRNFNRSSISARYDLVSGRRDPRLKKRTYYKPSKRPTVARIAASLPQAIFFIRL